MIKNPAPNFYEATCPKCGCVYMYQFEDLECEEIDTSEESDNCEVEGYPKLIKTMFTCNKETKRTYTTCPTCQEKAYHANMSGTLMGFAR